MQCDFINFYLKSQSERTPNAAIIDRAQARDDHNRVDWKLINEQRRQELTKRVVAVKRYIAQVERRALMGDSGALDGVELHHLPPLEAAIKEHAELVAWLREQLADVTWPGRRQ